MTSLETRYVACTINFYCSNL